MFQEKTLWWTLTIYYNGPESPSHTNDAAFSQTDGHSHTLVDITRAYRHIDNTEPFTWLKQVKTTTCGRSRKQCLAKLDKNLMTSLKNVLDPTKNNPGGSWIRSCVFRPPSDMVPD